MLCYDILYYYLCSNDMCRQDILLTNGEVVEVVLQESTTVRDTRVKESLENVVSSLRSGDTIPFEREAVEALVKELKQGYQLTREEVLQLVNHRPKTVLEAFLCVEQGILDGRIQEEDLEGIVRLL